MFSCDHLKNLLVLHLITISLLIHTAKTLSAQTNDSHLLPLDSILSILETKSQLHFSYANRIMEKKRQFAYPATLEGDWENNLKALLLDLDLSYRIIDKNLIIFRSKKNTLFGYVYDAETRESLPGAHLLIRDLLTGTTTNEQGYFHLKLPSDTIRMQVSFLGYRTTTLAIQINQDKRKDIYLHPSLDLPLVMVRQEPQQDAKSNNKYNSTTLGRAEANALPSLGTGMNVARSLQFVPGISSGSDGFDGMHVRGGGADQNLFLLDDIPIYNPFHMLGTTSIFHGDAIQAVNLEKSYFPINRGGRLSSVMNVTMRDGRQDKPSVKMGVSLLSAQGMVETPIGQNHSIMIAAERSLAGELVRNYTRRKKRDLDAEGYFLPLYHDIYSKVHLNLNNKNKFTITFYHGADEFREREDYAFSYDQMNNEIFTRDEYFWGNTAMGFRWHRHLGPNIFSKTHTYYSRYRYNSLNALRWLTDDANEAVDTLTDLTEFRSYIKEYGISQEFDLLAPGNHRITFGVVGRNYRYVPGIVAFDATDFLTDNFFNSDHSIPRFADHKFDTLTFQSTELSAYIGDQWSINDKLNCRYGIYHSTFFTEDVTYLSVQPRLQINYYTGRSDIKLSYSKMQQFNHQINTLGNGLPNELWVPSTRNIKPQVADILDLSTRFALTSQTWISSSVYYKWMDNLITFQDDANYLNIGKLENIDAINWENDVTHGNGSAWGIENSLSVVKDRWRAKINYAYSRSTRFFAKKFAGLQIPYQFERPHVAGLLAVIHFSKSLHFSWSWQIGSGVVLPLEGGVYDIFDEQGYYEETLDIPSTELELLLLRPYHRLDLSLSLELTRNRLTHRLKFSMLNAYDQVNTTLPRIYRDDVASSINFGSGLPALPSLAYHLTIE